MKPCPRTARFRPLWPIGLVLMVLLPAGCSAGKPAPPPPALQPPAKAAAVPRRNYPPPFTGSFWWPDEPEELPPTAFDKVKAPPAIAFRDRNGNPLTFEIAKFTLAAALPDVPAELPVFRAGAYSRDHRDRFNGPKDWVYPDYSEVASDSIPMAHPDPDHAAERAALLLRQYDLLMPDNEPARVYRTQEQTLVTFFRRINGVPVYNDRGPCVIFGKNGQVAFQIRRQPLLQRSLYPARSPQEAWQELLSGHFIKPTLHYCEDGGPPLPGKVTEFRVTSVELAYWEPQPNGPGEIVLPFYVFRNTDGATLYVPAIKGTWLAGSARAGLGRYPHYALGAGAGAEGASFFPPTHTGWWKEDDHSAPRGGSACLRTTFAAIQPVKAMSPDVCGGALTPLGQRRAAGPEIGAASVRSKR